MQPGSGHNQVKVGIFTSVHHPLDGRVFYKQAISLSRAGYRVELLCYMQDDIVMECEIDGIIIIPINKPAGSRVWRFLGLYKFIINGLKRKYDIVQIHDPELLPVAVIVKLLNGSKIIYDIHEDYESAITGKKWIPRRLRKIVSKTFSVIEAFFVRYYDALIATTKQIARKYNHSNITTIYNYPPFEKYVSNDGTSKDLKQLIYVGGITEARGIFETINALELLKGNINDFKIIFLGDFSSGDLERKVKSQISQKGLDDNIVFKPKVLYDEIFKFLSFSSIGLLPYLKAPNHYNTLPNKLFEYMATGNIVISNNLPQYKEIIDKYRCGAVVDVSDSVAYAETIHNLVVNKELAEELRNNALNCHREHCNWSIEERKLLYLYNKLLGGRI